MANFRAIWEINTSPKNISDGIIQNLLEREKIILHGLVAFSDFVFSYMDEDDANESKVLIASANTDLVAGIELARFGYLKQAYTLWRSWYEQVLFALYFLEAPIHRQAWKVSEAVSISDSPKYRLMLHQLLAESGEKHAFVLVYADRYEKLMGKMQKAAPKKDKPLQKAGKVLTVLSQGVHGTYRPAASKDNSELSKQISTHCLPTLDDAWNVVSQLWLLLLTNIVDLPSEALILLNQGNLSKEDIRKLFPIDLDENSDGEDTNKETAPYSKNTSTSFTEIEIDSIVNLNSHFTKAFN